MNHIFRVFIFIFISLSFTACSLYQSDGRKFLEKQAFTFSSKLGSSFSIISKKNHCIETDEIDMDFFENNDWTLLAESFQPSYSVYEANAEGNHSMIVALAPNYQSHFFACEYIHSSKIDLEQNKKENLENALETVKSMLN